MTSFNQPGWRNPKPATTEDHTALLAWRDELDAERAPILRCVCFVAVGDANHEIVEYEPEGCELHRGTLGKPA